MKILMAESSTTVGGQEQAVLLHAEGLIRRGHELRLIVEPESPIWKMATEKHIPVDQVRMRKSWYPSAIVAVRTLIAKERPDILHANSSRDSWVGALAARLVSPRPKVIRTRHISVPLNRNLATRLLYRKLIDLVIVTGGERTRWALVERDGLDPNRVAAFPIGLDVAFFKPGQPDRHLRDELKLPPDCKLVGIVSYLRAYKGHEYFIDAAARLLRDRQDACFLIVGEGPLESELRARIEALQAGDRLQILGFRRDLLNVLRSLDVFVIPSVEGDTIPQALMQALAVGVPVVSTTIGSIPDVVINGENGFVVRPRDGKTLAERIAVLLDDEGLRRRMGARGRALVEQSYSLDRMLDELEGAYRKVLRA